MVKSRAALLLTVALPSALGAAWNVCVQDSDALLSAPVRAAALREFSELMHTQRASLDFGDCSAEGHQIQLEVLAEAPEHLNNVLGQAYRRRERIEPVLNVYYLSLVRYLGHPNNAYAIGRAVARVAAHEVKHFLDQDPSHCSHGLLRPGFSAWELMAADSKPFLHGGDCRRVESLPALQHLVADARTVDRPSQSAFSRKGSGYESERNQASVPAARR